MVDAVETMAYSGEKPWHGLGKDVNDNLAPKAMLKQAGIDWSVSKRPMFLGGWEEKDGKKTPVLNGKAVQIPGKYALTRDTDHRILSVVGAAYNPVQNADAFEFFTKFVKAGHMKMETAGSLRGGKYVWGLANIQKSFKVNGHDDEVRGYLLLASPHVIGKALIAQFTGVRVVCWNTLSMALGANLKGRAGSFRMPHSMQFNKDTRDRAELALGLASEQLDEFSEAATLLAKTKAKPEQVKAYFYEILKTKEDVMAKLAESGNDLRLVKQLEQALEQAPGQQLPTTAGSWWGAFNAVTYVMDHTRGQTADNRLTSAWLGRTARVKRRALNLAVDAAKAA